VSDETDSSFIPGFIRQTKQIFKSDNSKKLSLFLSGNFSSGFFQIGSNSIGIIDLNKNLFCNYNTNDNICIDIAGPGRGPGDIGYSKDYSFKDGELIIASEDHRISFFDCTNDDCQFNRVLKTDIMPQAVTFTEDGFALVGSHLSLSSNASQAEKDERIINLYNKQGDVLKKIFNGYSTNSMLVKNFYHRSKIRYVESSNTLVIALNNLPYIYFYNLKNDEVTVFEIENFYLRDIIENKTENSLTMNYDKYSIIEIMEVLEDQYIYIGVRSHNDENDNEENFVRYYVIDSETFDSFFLGHDKILNNSISRYPILGNKHDNFIKISDSEISIIEQ
jgi:hypothetical protein